MIYACLHEVIEVVCKLEFSYRRGSHFFRYINCSYITFLTVYFIIQSIKMVHMSTTILVVVIIISVGGVLGQFPDYFDPVRAIQPPRRRNSNNQAAASR